MRDLTVVRQNEMIETLVKRLPLIRKEMNISQTELGEKVGLSRQTISAVERGTAELSWNNYLAIMMFLNANKDNCKTIFNDDSDNLLELLAVTGRK
ncbi:helix-turn-helix transcriptional regulator [Butyrivibrio sp. AC2005]|uniref:helix-turn-helix transcriptional regulator n=1 Tax=Butyrivibrio sp. AC2005 TaxID=1280672 RepID=UPI00041D0596|nr:helix-turn-helix transcriptional regulator [Butyrivibrio sp. AC2005]